MYRFQNVMYAKKYNMYHFEIFRCNIPTCKVCMYMLCSRLIKLLNQVLEIPFI